MRITGGKARGIPLKTPKGDSTRPATDALRQAVFSSLGARLEGLTVLDCFAGSGAYGLEALSRGAASISFVEKDRRALACLKENLAAVSRSLGQQQLCQVRGADAFRWQPESPPQLIFADPPYPLLRQRSQELLAHLARIAAPETLLVLEAPGDFELPPSPWEAQQRLGKGGAHQPVAWVLHRQQNRPAPAV